MQNFNTTIIIMNIQELIGSGQNITVAVTAADLAEFAESLLKKGREEARPEEPDREISRQEAARQLGRTTMTLWRWERVGYLVPVARVGGYPVYLQSQIDKIKRTNQPFPSTPHGRARQKTTLP